MTSPDSGGLGACLAGLRGTELVAGPGGISSLPSGHDAWVVGEEPVVVVDWYGAGNYASEG